MKPGVLYCELDWIQNTLELVYCLGIYNGCYEMYKKSVHHFTQMTIHVISRAIRDIYAGEGCIKIETVIFYVIKE